MRSWLNELGLLLTACGALCVAAGCQSGGNFDAVEREIRWKEDRIYHLEDHLEDYKKRLESAQRENETLRSELEASKGGGSASPWSPGSDGLAPPTAAPPASGPSGLPPVGGMDSGTVGSAGEAPDFDNEPIISPPGEGVPEGIEVRGGTPAPSIPPAETLPSGGGADSSFDRALPDDIPAGGLSFRLGPDEVSAVDTSEDSGSRSASPEDDDLPASPLPPFEPSSHGEGYQGDGRQAEELLPPPPSFDDVSFGRPRKHVPTLADSVPADTATVDTTYPLPASVDQVAEVTFNKLLTGGHDTSDALGDEGVLVVIEPRNTAGEIVDVAGQVDIAVIDPQLSGSDRDVAHWRFAPGEAAEHFRETILGAGMHFDLPWPNRSPQNAALELHVRYTTPEGEKFTLKEEIKVDPPASGEMATQPPTAGKRARLLPPRAVDGPQQNQAQSRQRMARIGRPRFHGPDEQQDREQQQGSSDADQPAPRSPRRADTQLAPPAWTPYR
jgi:hypothetical protein